MIGKLVVAIIRLYQKTLSPDHGWFRIFYPAGYCKFQPTCSQYCIAAIEKKGLLIGFFKGIYRILRCNPWSKGGYDPA